MNLLFPHHAQRCSKRPLECGVQHRSGFNPFSPDHPQFTSNRHKLEMLSRLPKFSRRTRRIVACSDGIQSPDRSRYSIVAPGLWSVMVSLLLFLGLNFAQAAGSETDLAKSAMSVFRDSCLSCHNTEKAKGGLIMETREALIRGSDSGEVVVDGKPEESYLLETLTDPGDAHMPPKKQLEETSIAQLSAWIEIGMPWDKETLQKLPDLQPQEWELQKLPNSYRPVLAMAANDTRDRMLSSQGSELIVTRLVDDKLEQVRLPTAHKESVRAVAVTPDGTQWVSGGFGRLIFWDVETQEIIREWSEGLKGQINAITFTRDGSRMLVAEGIPGLYGNIHVYSGLEAPPERTWQAHADEVFDIQESHDGSYWMTASADHTVRIWESDSGIEQDWLEGHSAPVMALVMNGEGSLLISAGSDNALKVWDMKSRERLFDLGRRPQYSFLDVCWEPEKSQLFAINQKGDLYRYLELKEHTGAQSSSTGSEKVMARTKKPLSCLTYWASQKSLVVGTFEGELQAFDLNGKTKWTLPSYDSGPNDLVSR